MEEYAGIVIGGRARNITITGCTVDGVLIPDFDSERPAGRRSHCTRCDVYGDGVGFVRTHSVGDHGKQPAPSGRRADRRPRSAWLAIWTIARRARLALAGFAAFVRRDWRGILIAAAVYIGGAAAIYLLTLWFQSVGIL